MKKSYIIIGVIVVLVIVAIVCFAIYNNRIKDNTNSYNSASSQFFIMQEDTPSLDGQYAAFGKVTDGIEIVDKICEDTQVEDSNGTVLKENQPVIEKITMID